MSNLKDLRVNTGKLRLEQKHVPSRVWDAIIMGRGNYTPQNWNKAEIIRNVYERNPAYYAAANIVAQAIADLPTYVEVTVNGKKQRSDSHPALSLLERDTAKQEFIERFCLYYIVTGEAYAQIVTSTHDDRPLALICLPSQHVKNVEGDYTKPIAGYEYTETKSVYFGVDDVIHAYKPSLSRYFQAMSPAVPLAESIDLNNAAITWNKNTAVAGGIPPIIVTAQNATKEDGQQLREMWAEQSGAGNSHVLKVMSGELEFHKTNMSPHDAEWERAVLMSMRMIFMTLNVSSSMMNDAGNKTYNNVHESRKSFYTEGIIPLAKRIYSAFSSKIKNRYKDKPVYCIDTDNIDAVQEDRKELADRLVKLVESGIMTANEARKELRLPRAEGESADMLQNSSIVNNIPAQERPQDNPPPVTNS
jgi:HK97 family phage portal protein